MNIQVKVEKEGYCDICRTPENVPEWTAFMTHYQANFSMLTDPPSEGVRKESNRLHKAYLKAIKAQQQPVIWLELETEDGSVDVYICKKHLQEFITKIEEFIE